MNITLIGMRGSGKSTVAELLARHKLMKLVSTDEMIVKKVGMTITEIVTKRGWHFFRTCETKVISQLPGTDNTVIDTGGGAILDSTNTTVLKALGKVVWLTAPIEVLYQRIAGEMDRPDLRQGIGGLKEMQIIFEQRKNLYHDAATVIVDTNKKTPTEVVKEITL